MMTEQLLQYGALGAFTLYLILEKRTQGAVTIKALDRNTAAFYTISEVIKNCQAGKK
jgi:hypothetical protein